MSRTYVAERLAVVALCMLGSLALPAQKPGQPLDEKSLRDYAGYYRWESGELLYLQPWGELAGRTQLVAVDASGEVRTLYNIARDTFFASSAAAISSPVESRVIFQRTGGEVSAVTWRRGENAPRIARRARIERREEARFTNGDIQLAGTLISPATPGRHPAIVLVHGSGAEDREYLLPLAHFLVERGIALFGYDKRGVGGSSGDWRVANYEDLASDVVAAVRYLESRDDMDAKQIGLLGWSQAGWVMPLAASRTSNIAFLISVSGAAIPPWQTAIDATRSDLTARGMKRETIEDITALMRLQYDYARTGQGWDAYASAREKLVARIGRAPESFPGTPNAPYWGEIKRMYLYDPAPALTKLRVPTLALFGELDDNILATKSKPAWEEALRAAGNTDYSLMVVPRANHLMLEAKIGSTAEMPSLQRFAPAYRTTVQDWLAKHVSSERTRR
jgi:uncharacterized protein